MCKNSNFLLIFETMIFETFIFAILVSVIFGIFDNFLILAIFQLLFGVLVIEILVILERDNDAHLTASL